MNPPTSFIVVTAGVGRELILGRPVTAREVLAEHGGDPAAAGLADWVFGGPAPGTYFRVGPAVVVVAAGRGVG